MRREGRKNNIVSGNTIKAIKNHKNNAKIEFPSGEKSLSLNKKKRWELKEIYDISSKNNSIIKNIIPIVYQYTYGHGKANLYHFSDGSIKMSHDKEISGHAIVKNNNIKMYSKIHQTPNIKSLPHKNPNYNHILDYYEDSNMDYP